jgi:hypothetical protein
MLFSPNDAYVERKKVNRYEKIDKHKAYGRKKTLSVQLLYLFAAVIWIIFCAVMGFTNIPWVGLVILAIPLVIFGIGFFNANKITVEVEDTIFMANYLSIGLLIVIPLLAWMDKVNNNNKERVITAMIAGIVLSMLSLVDIWVRPKWLSFIKHLKSVLQTASLTLLIYAIYLFIIGRQ